MPKRRTASGRPELDVAACVADDTWCRSLTVPGRSPIIVVGDARGGGIRMRVGVLAALVGVVVVVTGLFVYGYPRAITGSPAAPIRERSPAAVAGAVDPARKSSATEVPGRPGAPPREESEPRYFDGTRNFGELIQRVNAARNGADALKAKMDAATLCDMTDRELDERFARWKKRNGGASAAEASFDAYKAYRKRFCVGWNGETVGTVAGEMLDLDPSNDLNTSQQVAEDDDTERAVAMALDLVRNSESAAAIRNAAVFLSNAGDGAWTDGQEVVQGTYLFRQLPQIRLLAVDMIACELGGGCESDGFYAWAACQAYDLCHPGVSMDEIWRRTNPPDFYDAARRMAASMRRSSETH
ncbi:hypothetical protein [Dokdonella sp.]|uniref:hypothetical protein n=1 Tax=Dokdonella sp. TaxID=2291710 RepID=UPI002F3FC34F